MDVEWTDKFNFQSFDFIKKNNPLAIANSYTKKNKINLSKYLSNKKSFNVYNGYNELLTFDHRSHKRKYNHNDKLIMSNLNDFRKMWHQVRKPMNFDYNQDL